MSCEYRRQPRRDRADRDVNEFVVEGCSVKELRCREHGTAKNGHLNQIGHTGDYHG